MAHNRATSRAKPLSGQARSTRPTKPGDEPSAKARIYDRRIELPRILPLWPHELDDQSPQGRMRIIIKLRRALRAERRRGIAGHWTYDLARHMELVRAYRRELALGDLCDIDCPRIRDGRTRS